MGPMEGRWVCRRCFASNDADAPSCGQCGLERGADPQATDSGAIPARSADAAGAADAQQPAPRQWGAPPPPPPRPMWQQLTLRFWWIGLIAVIALGGWYFSARRDETGQIANAGDLQMTDLQVGDCFDLKDPDAQVVDKVEAKPCTQAHEYEMYFAADMPGGNYPSEDEFTTWIQQNCLPAFESYVGMGFDESALQILPVTPTEELWHDDRSVQCALVDPGDEELTSSLKGAAR
jgi:hypothetical protein